MFKLSIPPAELTSLTIALQDTFAMKGGDPAKIVNKAARYVVSFAMASGVNAKIPAATSERIGRDLSRVVATGSFSRLSTTRGGKRKKINRKSATQNEWRGTYAAAIVASIIAGRAGGKIAKRYLKLVGRLQKGKKATAAQFYRVVASFVRSKRASARYLRSGLIPAMNTFKAANQDASSLKRSFKLPPGTAEAATNGSRRIVARMEDSAKEISRFAPDAFKIAERQVADLFDKWIVEEGLNPAARRQGLTTT